MLIFYSVCASENSKIAAQPCGRLMTGLAESLRRRREQHAILSCSRIDRRRLLQSDHNHPEQEGETVCPVGAITRTRKRAGDVHGPEFGDGLRPYRKQNGFNFVAERPHFGTNYSRKVAKRFACATSTCKEASARRSRGDHDQQKTRVRENDDA